MFFGVAMSNSIRGTTRSKAGQTTKVMMGPKETNEIRLRT